MTELHDPGNTGPIDKLYAIISFDSEGNMGLCASILPGLGSTPLISGTRTRIEMLAKRFIHEVSDLGAAGTTSDGKNYGIVTFRWDLQEPEWLTNFPVAGA